ncbi:MAG: hypothetical protein A3D44_00985 [Candidatus Staskawiczbacteria bacterium RIFCSPHIGHO2_02_FULL_42_22]|uniref:Uncharacterized protein n=1 Tax=Candidatus Staskawiczbacteria bacterium RIFCSPHIGHO2_02_FULL_42_22 TaxID=1802207 RepID=A0A1G2I3L4_9BACT|nr:MAG: hypothetical protein A3D44_00985 [Candidatus Staskawiczbacteria bacterium RIFCSPHIGHO2_02_FULL_42_22]
MFRRSLPTPSTFLQSWRENYPQITRDPFIFLPNEIRITSGIFRNSKNFGINKVVHLQMLSFQKGEPVK